MKSTLEPGVRPSFTLIKTTTSKLEPSHSSSKNKASQTWGLFTTSLKFVSGLGALGPLLHISFNT